jgi:NADH-quinone oxidoreductase subunit G
LVELSGRQSVVHSLSKRTGKPLGSTRVGALLGQLVDIEGAYALGQYIKSLGYSDIQYGNHNNAISPDWPSLFTLNRPLSEFQNLGALLMVGLNARLEAPLFNALLRKHQLRRALPYAVLGAPASLRLKHAHCGVGLRSLVALVENRSTFVSVLYNTFGSSVLAGYEAFKTASGSAAHKLVRFLAKKLLTQNRAAYRLGVLHQHVGSLAACELGLLPGVRSSVHSELVLDKKFSTIFAFQLSEFNRDKWSSSSIYSHVVACSTHKQLSFYYDRLVPLKSNYEKDGFLISAEGRLRRHNKVVDAPSGARALETFLAALCALQKDWRNSDISTFWGLSSEVVIERRLEKTPIPFTVGFVDLAASTPVFGPLAPFTPPVADFYLGDVVSSHSSTMGECSLFLGDSGNFLAEV